MLSWAETWPVAARLRVYFAEMYPLPRRALLAALLALGFTRVLLRAQARPFDLLCAASLRAAAAVFTLMLILRLMDELKDLDVDRQLFPSRPLPSLRVRPSDVAACLALSVLAWFALHAGLGRAALSASAVLVYALLMFRWFFVRAYLRPRLLATLATHTPVVPLLLLHLALLADVTAPHAAPWRAARVAVLVVQFWSAVVAWEIARKIRSAEEEDEYVTYSRLLGRRGAVALAFLAQPASVACGLVLTWRAGLVPAAAALLALALLVVARAHLRFLCRPGPATSQLRAPAEAFTALTCVWGLVA